MPLRRRKPAPPTSPFDAVDPMLLPPAYRATVADARRAREQFERLRSSTAAGPMQDRLGELGERVDAGVLGVWRAATHAVELERVVGGLDPQRVTEELKQARRSGADDAVVEALVARFASTNRLLDALDDARRRLPLLEARLSTAVARAAEVALTSSLAPVHDELAGLERDLDGVVVELDALGRATDELA